MDAPITMRIRDLGLAAALVSLGCTITRTYKDDHGRTYFVFVDDHGLKIKINQYWSDTLTVKARKIMDNTKMLKSVIHTE